MDDSCDNQIADTEKHRWRLEPCPVNVLQHLLTGPLGFSTVGVAVELDGGPVIIYARLGALLTDGEGWSLRDLF